MEIPPRKKMEYVIFIRKTSLFNQKRTVLLLQVADEKTPPDNFLLPVSCYTFAY